MDSGARNMIVVADAAALAAQAAERLLGRLANGGQRPAICLAGGSSPMRLYELLASDGYRARIPWDRVHWFIGDDRFVPIEDPLNNMGIARRLFLDACAPAENIHAIPTSSSSPDTAARLYEDELRKFYGDDVLHKERPLFDLVLMGVGPDGHTASIFPKSAALDERERWVTGVDRANVAPFVPRVTLTLPTLASCREMLFLVGGVDKHAILSRIMAGEDLPAGRAASQGETTWLVDASAAGAAYDH